MESLKEEKPDFTHKIIDRNQIYKLNQKLVLYAYLDSHLVRVFIMMVRCWALIKNTFGDQI
jgi:hypothetical protein